MQKFLLVVLFSIIIPFSIFAQYQTVCNPVNLSYMFSSDKPSYREAADPSLVLFQDEYYLFVSKSGGYFHSTDLITWDLIKTNDLPLDNYAPTAVVIDDYIYFLTSGNNRLYKTSDPKSGKWEVAKSNFPYTDTDPMLFLDDDGRLYYYAGCSNVDPIKGVEIDTKTFNRIGTLTPLIQSNKEEHGWEVPGNFNTSVSASPWIEGVWMNKYKGKYYLQYASPGTEFRSYNDGVYVSDNPLGPFTLAKHNPFAYKPEGFVCGAGHGSTFQDKYGNYWHFGTSTISKRHSFERRISLFPVFFDEDNVMYAYTAFGDYPMIIPEQKIDYPEQLFPDWMLLSYKKEVEVSSVYQSFNKNLAGDENIQTWWSAETGNRDEYISIDLGNNYDVYGLQLNFADQDADLAGRKVPVFYQYEIHSSSDGVNWNMLIDKSQNEVDAPHDYIQLNQPVETRYLKLCNVKVPSGKLSVSDFRVFGFGHGDKPKGVETFRVRRYKDNSRSADISWSSIPDATGYNIRYGYKKDKLYLNYLVYGRNSLTLSSLDAGQNYFFTIDAFNENGITYGTNIQSLNDISSINEFSKKDFLVFPNPVKDRIWIETNTDYKDEIMISLFDTKGDLIKQDVQSITSGKNILSMNLAPVPSGIYIIQFTSTDTGMIRYKKIIIEK